jgi:hypothetical protein
VNFNVQCVNIGDPSIVNPSSVNVFSIVFFFEPVGLELFGEKPFECGGRSS